MKPQLKIFVLISLLLISLSAAHAQDAMVYGGGSGKDHYLCKVRPNGGVIPGVAKDLSGAAWQSFSQRIKRANRNHKLTPVKRAKIIKRARKLSRKVSSACRANLFVLSGTWIGALDCSQGFTEGCSQGVMLQFDRGLYTASLRGGHVGYRNGRRSIYEFQIESRGTYRLAGNSLALTQTYGKANWESYALGGHREEIMTEPRVLSFEAAVDMSGGVLAIRGPAPFPSDLGLHFEPDAEVTIYQRQN